VILAAFVTSQARLKLFSELKKLGRRALYVDTDSIIYISRPGEYDPPLGSYLGQFTSEIEAAYGNYIKAFVCAGMKSYSYMTDKNYTDCTVKGITIGYLVNSIITFELIKRLVFTDALSNRKSVVKIPQLKFLRNRKMFSLKTTTVAKDYRYVFDKRVVQDDMFTLPHGF
jgi:hypothetical protein